MVGGDLLRKRRKKKSPHLAARDAAINNFFVPPPFASLPVARLPFPRLLLRRRQRLFVRRPEGF